MIVSQHLVLYLITYVGILYIKSFKTQWMMMLRKEDRNRRDSPTLELDKYQIIP